ncbi:MAG TPA: DUF1367 family protein [Balneolales bacterium]|nr:DUF1367 family protein [Balneolales bacterium]
MEATFLKTRSGLVPDDPNTQNWYDKIPLAGVVRGKFTKMRNPYFHRKMFALFNMAYDLWEPGEINSKYGTPQRNFERFRKDLVILAGFYHVVIRVDGTTRIEADSLRYDKMNTEQFVACYSAIIDVLLQKLPGMGSMTRVEVDATVDKVLSFA